MTTTLPVLVGAFYISVLVGAYYLGYYTRTIDQEIRDIYKTISNLKQSNEADIKPVVEEPKSVIVDPDDPNYQIRQAQMEREETMRRLNS